MQVLFESRLEIVRTQGKLQSIQHAPSIWPEPVLVGDPATHGGADGAGVTIYGSVLADGGCYRMWYQAWPADWDGRDTALVGYAESQDGIKWRRRSLGLADYAGVPSHLCDLGFHSPSVFIDPEAPPAARYRATGCCSPRLLGVNPASTEQGYYSAHSADGLHWELDSPVPTWRGADVITSVYHSGRRAAVVALKHSPYVRGMKRRSIWNATFKNGAWGEPRTALVPDEFDDVCASARGYASGDYYGMGMLPAGHGLVGFLWNFRHTLPRTPGSELGVFGAVDVSLAYQAEAGGRWLHQAGRPDFVSHTQVPWGQGGVYTAAAPVEVGDEHWLYFAGATESHGWYLSETWQRLNERRDDLCRRGLARIGVARWPRYRLFGLQADPQGEVDIYLGQLRDPAELLLNYTTQPGGHITVTLLGNQASGTGAYMATTPLSEGLPLAGRSGSEAVPLEGQSTNRPVAWTDGTVIQPAPGHTLTARIALERATVYAYELRRPLV